MSQIENNLEVVSWFIDRTPDYNVESSQDTIVDETVDYVEATNYLVEYEMTSQYNVDRIIRENLYLSAIRQAIINNNEQGEDFIPFGNHIGRNRMNSSPVNFIVHKFELLEEEKTCCICIDEKDDEQICCLNCLHKFCVECINIHLKKNQNCPLCRTYIIQIQTQTIEARRQINP